MPQFRRNASKTTGLWATSDGLSNNKKITENVGITKY
jgi:hypothetical protein